MDRLYTDRFAIDYRESQIDSSVLWESHCHAQFELIGVLEGDVSIAIEGRDYRLNEGQVAIIPPLCYHTITANERQRYRRMTVLFDREAIPYVLCPEFAGYEREPILFFSSRIEELRQICREERLDFYVPLAESLMVQILYDCLQGRRGRADGETDEFLQRTLSYIDSHLHEKISLDDLARHVSRSKSSFCHLFEGKMSVSPKQYILQKRMALANKLIGDGIPPTVAAGRVGYDNYSNFYRMYVKRCGERPTKK